MRFFSILIFCLILPLVSFASDEFDKDMELATLGNAGGQFRVGARYLNGEGVDMDYSQAIVWLTKAADQDHSNALFNLGYIYLYGVGVKVDFVKAANYFEKSSKGGFLPGYHMLGIMYYDGAGVVKDLKKAYEYCKIAADAGYEPSIRIIDTDNKTIQPNRQ